MKTISIISPSLRQGRYSHRVALFFKRYIEEKNIAAAEILDLREYEFPLFGERLRRLADPLPASLHFASRISAADGIIMIVPEYNGGYPASLKNVIDLLYDEWYRKPVAISTVSDGPFGGVQVITSVQFVLWKMKAWTVPATFPVTLVSKSYDESGTPADKETAEKRASAFISELMWCVDAVKRMA